MFGSHTEDAAVKAAKKAEDRKNAEQKAQTKTREEALTAAFNAVAEMEKSLTALHNAHPKFEFIVEKTANGADFLTNIPLERDADRKEDLSINIAPRGIVVISDPYDYGAETFEYEPYKNKQVKKAAKLVGQYVGKKGLAS